MNPVLTTSPVKNPLAARPNANSSNSLLSVNSKKSDNARASKNNFQKMMQKPKKSILKFIFSSVLRLIRRFCCCCYCFFCSYRCMNVSLTLVSIILTSFFFGTFVTILMLVQNENRISDIRTLSTSNLILLIKVFDNFLDLILLLYYLNPIIFLNFGIVQNQMDLIEGFRFFRILFKTSFLYPIF